MPLIKTVLVNGNEEERDYLIRENDEVTVIRNDEEDFDFEEVPDPLQEKADASLEDEADIPHEDEADIPHEDEADAPLDSDEEEKSNPLTLILNQRLLRVQAEGEHYFLEDLLALLRYNASGFYERFSIRINGMEVEENCMLNEGDEIEFIYKN